MSSSTSTTCTSSDMTWDYQALRGCLQQETLPVALVDLDILDGNIRRIAELVQKHQKKMRLATKSVRVPALIRRILEKGGEAFQGLMCFSPSEAVFLSEEGFDDLLIAYPSTQHADLLLLWELTQSGRSVTLMIDEPIHIQQIDAFWRQQGNEKAIPLKVCLDLDMAYRPLGMHMGAQRSPLRSLKRVQELVTLIQASDCIQLQGLMGYEAQIAGLSDKNPFTPMMNTAKTLFKKRSVVDVAKKRAEIATWFQKEAIQLAFFNGGGSGSLDTTSLEDCITEVTAGSGFLQPHLFDYYANNRNQAAILFGLRVTRIPQAGMVTCQSGGFIASGEISLDKAPVPFLPPGLVPTSGEGFGEVQTPLKVPKNVTLQPGDPVFFRPAKAGEIAERFNEYLLLQNHQIVDRVKTYRGLGKCFH